MFKALHLTPPIEEDDIEIAKKKLKDILGFTEAENGFDDIDSDIDDEGHHPDGEEFYVVEKVLDRSLVNGVQKFKVKWEGHEDITWEPLDNFVSRGSKMAIFLYYVRRWEKKLEKMAVSDEARKEKSHADGNPGSSKVRAKSEQESKNEVQAVCSIFGQIPADGRGCQSSFNRTSTNDFLKTIKEEQKRGIERRKKRETLEKQMKEERLRRNEEKDRERRMKQLKKDLGSSSDED
uniref:Chromo domain-containing protein n=1 Tax=Panagrolaimus davidi TaxID=227884 RepID=A0A914QXB8_9BILA